MVKKVFVLGGANGAYNTGDDAMFEVFTQRILQYNPKTQIFTDSMDLSWNPKESAIKKIIYFDDKMGLLAKIFSGNSFSKNGRTYYKKSIMNFFRLVRESDAVAFSGAGGVNDKYYGTAIFKWGMISLMAFLLRKKVVMSSQGIGPLKNPLLRIFARYLRLLDIIEVREKMQSKEILLSLGVKRSKIIEAPDNAVLVRNMPIERLKNLKSRLNLPKKFIIFNFHIKELKKNRKLLGKINGLFKTLYSRGYSVILLGNKFYKKDDDRVFLKNFLKVLGNPVGVKLIEEKLSSVETKAVIGLSSGVISSRYHLCVYALSLGKVAIPIYSDEYYKTKMQGLLEWFGVKNKAVSSDVLANSEEKFFLSVVNSFSDKKMLAVLRVKAREVRILKEKSLKNIMKIIL